MVWSVTVLDKLTGWDGLTELASPETVVQTVS